MDRVGDTYRWKGENVSTVEVANTMADNNSWLVETNCYGVKVPWAEGACGALAITIDGGDLELSGEFIQRFHQIRGSDLSVKGNDCPSSSVFHFSWQSVGFLPFVPSS